MIDGDGRRGSGDVAKGVPHDATDVSRTMGKSPNRKQYASIFLSFGIQDVHRCAESVVFRSQTTYIDGRLS